MTRKWMLQPVRLCDGGALAERRSPHMAKLHARPSNQYRYEHYDPR